MKRVLVAILFAIISRHAWGQVQLGKGVQIGAGASSTGVSQVVAGANVTVSPTNGSGVVTINSTAASVPQYIAPQSVAGCGVEYVTGDRKSVV